MVYAGSMRYTDTAARDAPPSVTHLFTSLVGSVVKRPIGNGQSAERSSVEVEREGGNCPQTRMFDRPSPHHLHE